MEKNLLVIGMEKRKKKNPKRQTQKNPNLLEKSMLGSKLAYRYAAAEKSKVSDLLRNNFFSERRIMLILKN